MRKYVICANVQQYRRYIGDEYVERITGPQYVAGIGSIDNPAHIVVLNTNRPTTNYRLAIEAVLELQQRGCAIVEFENGSEDEEGA